MNDTRPADQIKWKKVLILAIKIAVGSSVSIALAEALNLQFAASAGITTLLTLLNTRQGTLQLSAARIMTFAVSVAFAWITFWQLESAWLAYGIFIFLLVFFCESMDLRATISVNAVIGTHFFDHQGFQCSVFHE